MKIEELRLTVGSLESKVKQKDMAINNLTSMTQKDELKVEKRKAREINRDINSERISVSKRMEELDIKCGNQEEEI